MSSSRRQSSSPGRVLLGLGLLTFWFVGEAQAQDPASLGTSRLQEIASDLWAQGALAQAVPYLAELDRRLQESTDPAVIRARESVLFLLGLGRLQRMDLEGAERALADFIAQYPASPRIASARLYRGDTFFYRQHWHDAAVIYGELVAEGTVGLLASDLQARFWEHYADAVFMEQDWTRAATVFPAFAQSIAGWTDRRVAAEKRAKASSYAMQAALATEDFEAALAEVPFIRAQPGTARYDVSLNLALLRGGDRLYEAQRFGEALHFYELVLRPDELRAYWEAHVARLETERRQRAGVAWYAERLRQIEQDLPPARARLAQLGVETRQNPTEAVKVVAEYGPALSFRIARCYLARGRSFEAYWAFRRLEEVAAANRNGDTAAGFGEEALYGQVNMAAVCGFDDRVARLARRYLRSAPYTRFIGEVAHELLQTEVRAENRPALRELTAILLERVRLDPQLPAAPKLVYLVGSTLLDAGEATALRHQLEPMLAEYPDRGFSDGLHYWLGMVEVLAGEYRSALAHFETVGRVYPESGYGEDASYRVGVCWFGLLDYPKARLHLEGFLADHPESRLVGEAHALLGDLAGAEGRWESALQAYAAAREAGAWMSPPNWGYLNHAVFAAGSIFAAQGRWVEMAEWFEAYLRRWGRQGRAGDALYQLGRAQIALGRTGEMLELWIESILEFGNDPRDTGPDLMLAEFSEHFRAIRGVSPEPVLRDALAIAQAESQLTLQFRLALALEELGVNPRSLPRPTHDTIASGSTAVLLATARRERTTDPELAIAAAERALVSDPWGPFAADTLGVLAELHTAAHRHAEAIAAWRRLAESFPAHETAATARLRQGDLERERGAFAAAIEAYRAVLQVRQWRGPAWAEAYFKIGLTHLEQGDYTAAFGFCQRVYVLYARVENWAAEAYLVSGLALERMNRSGEAAATYRELLADERLADEAAAQTAAARLEALEEVS